MSASVVVPKDSSRRTSVSRPDAKILFQQFFKSVGPRTYAAQVKAAGNGNHFVVLTEARRQRGDQEPRKTRLFVFSEDFVEFFKLLSATAQFIKANPVRDDVRARQQKYWSQKREGDDPAARPHRTSSRPSNAHPSSRAMPSPARR